MDWVFKPENYPGSPIQVAPVSILVVLDWVFKQGWETADRLVRSSFNPCCIGLGIQTRRIRQHGCIAQYVSILVVLDWVFKLSSACQVHRHVNQVSILVVLDWVFKPLPAFRVSGVMNAFQSLLYWIGYSNLQSAMTTFAHFWFQSLLYWIGYSNPAESHPSAEPGRQFQSLLYWIGYSNNRMAAGRRLATHRVSILVVLDWVFKLE